MEDTFWFLHNYLLNCSTFPYLNLMTFLLNLNVSVQSKDKSVKGQLDINWFLSLCRGIKVSWCFLGIRFLCNLL